MNSLDTFTSQRTFRALLDTLARPGRIGTIPYEATTPDTPAALAVPLALADITQSVAAIDTDPQAAQRWEELIQGATNCAITDPVDADQVVALGAVHPDLILALRRGDALKPEAGCRLTLACEQLTAIGEADQTEPRGTPGPARLELRGPGIAAVAQLEVTGIEPAVFAALVEANRQFPAGIDTFLVDATRRVIGIPRSTTVTVSDPTEGTTPWDM